MNRFWTLGLLLGLASSASAQTSSFGLPLPFPQDGPSPTASLPPPSPPGVVKAAVKSGEGPKTAIKQVEARLPDPPPDGGKYAKPIVDPNVKKASCSSCGGGLLGRLNPHESSCDRGGCCANGKCIPGRTRCCSWVDYNTPSGRLIGGFYDCICCPDPCYEPCWIPEANNAMFQDNVRPVTQTRLRWDSGFDVARPDAGEWFWARIGGRGPANPETNVDYNTLTLYQEIAAKNFSFFFELPYMEVDPDINAHGAGFGDMNLGFKTLFVDCELMQMSFQFRTYLPTGNAGKGVGVGHTSMDLSLQHALKITNSTYLQTQIGEFFPIGGDPAFASSILHYHVALNQRIWQPVRDIMVVGSLEYNGWSFQDGLATDPALGAIGISRLSYMNVGPSARLIFCNKIDLGFGAVFSIADRVGGADTLYRTEFRWRF